MSATKIVCVRCERVCVSVMMGVYQYFHVCFRVESGRNKSLVLCELV